MTDLRNLIRVRRRAGGALLVAALVLGAPSTDAGGAPAPADELRAERATVLARVAELTDAAEAAAGRRQAARARAEVATIAAVDARRRLADAALGAYLLAVSGGEDGRQRGGLWAELRARADAAVLEDLEGSRRAADGQLATAERAAEEARAAAEELESARQLLEDELAVRVELDAEAAAEAERNAAARRAATAAPSATAPPSEDAPSPTASRRTTLATADQAELLDRFPFGPVDGLPDGLDRTGDVVEGRASWYGPGFDGRLTASGAVFDQEGWTVASRTLPLGTILLVTANGRSVLVLVNDRGPYVDGRVLDLSRGVADALGTLRAGVAPVRADVVVPA